jgi:transposase
VGGAREAAQLSGMVLGRERWQRLQRAVAGAGQCTTPHATLMARALTLVDVQGQQLTASAQQHQGWRDPLASQREPLPRLSGVNTITARARLAERSLAMTHVGSAARLAAWAGVAPGHNTRGATPSGRTCRGPRELRRMLRPWPG